MATDKAPVGKLRAGWNDLAKSYGISGFATMSNKDLLRKLQSEVKTRAPGKSVAEAVDTLKGVATTTMTNSVAVTEKSTSEGTVVDGDVLPPTATNNSHSVAVHSPHIHMNVPAPVVNISSREAPTWHEAVSTVWAIGLHMVLGAAMWALFSPQVLHVAQLVGR